MTETSSELMMAMPDTGKAEVTCEDMMQNGEHSSDEVVDDQPGNAAEEDLAQPAPDPVKPLYIVRLPRPDVDVTIQKVLAAELEIHHGKIKLLNEHLSVKRVSLPIAVVYGYRVAFNLVIP